MRFRKTITLTIAVALACAGLSGCGQSSADTAKTFMDAVAAGDTEKVESMLATSDMGVAQAKPAKPITDVTIGEASDDRVPVSYKVDGEKVETSLSMQKTDDGWKVNPKGILTKAKGIKDKDELSADGTSVTAGQYLLPGVHGFAESHGWWSMEWTLPIDGATEDAQLRPSGDAEADATFTVSASPADDDTVNSKLQWGLENLNTCKMFEDETYGGDATLVGPNSYLTACNGGVTDASNVTITGYEQDSEDGSLVHLTLGGTYVAKGLALTDYDDEREALLAMRDGARCDQLKGTGHLYQCGAYEPKEYSADSLTATVKLSMSEGLGVLLTDETKNSIVDTIYAGHGTL